MDKTSLRKQTWASIRRAGAARFPGVEGRIPNFVGAEAAARHLFQHPAWAGAQVIKVNPDSPQRPVRHGALKQGKILVLPVPRLAGPEPFWILDPAELPDGSLWHASSIKGGTELGRLVSADQVPPLDLIVTGCVAVGTRGERLGKGGGYSDLEYAMLRELDLVGPDTPILSTVHPVQLHQGTVPMQAHDISVDAVATPDGLVVFERRHARPSGVLPDRLDRAKIDAIPALARRFPAR
jgi:5-formyltetrahydrofolate cyclo-ligase